MTAPPIAPVIPSPGRLAGTSARQAGCGPSAAHGRAGRRLVRSGGRGIRDRSYRCLWPGHRPAITGALAWREGDRLTVTASPGVVTARRDPRGMVTVPARACLAIPAVLRRRCGLRAGDRVLLAAVPGQDMLAAYSFAVVDQAIGAHGVFPHASGGQP